MLLLDVECNLLSVNLYYKVYVQCAESYGGTMFKYILLSSWHAFMLSALLLMLVAWHSGRTLVLASELSLLHVLPSVDG